MADAIDELLAQQGSTSADPQSTAQDSGFKQVSGAVGSALGSSNKYFSNLAAPANDQGLKLSESLGVSPENAKIIAANAQSGGMTVGGIKDVAGEAKLAMDQASRMARAKEMGFDTEKTFYHGTPSNIKQFRVSEDGTFGPGVYVTDDPRTASYYATGDNSNIIPLHIKSEKPFSTEKGFKIAPEDADKMDEILGEGFVQAHSPKSKSATKFWANSYQDLVEDFIDTHGLDEQPAAEAARAKLMSAVRNAGYDSFRAGDTTVVFHPKNIRSVNATFNPAKASSKNILAGAAGAGAAGAGMANSDNSNAQGYAAGGAVSGDALDQLLDGAQAPSTPQPNAPAPASVPQQAAPAETDPLDSIINGEKNESLSENLKGAAEGFGSALTLGASTALEKGLGIAKDADINRRRDTTGHTLGTAAGLIAPALATDGLSLTAPALANTAGHAVESVLGSGIVGAAARQAAEMALFQGGDEISKYISNAPQSLDSAISNIGMSALVGGAFGGGLSVAGKALSKASEVAGLGKLAADFKGRVTDFLNNPAPNEAVTKELQDYYTATKGAADEVYGASGLKSQDIGKLMPEELTPKITEQAAGIIKDAEEALSKLGDDPHARLLKDEVDNLKQVVNSAGSPGEVFEATQKTKQQLQEWGSYNKKMVALGERPFRDAARGLATSLKEALEDSNVWGKAAERQAAINKGFSEYLTPLKDFEKRFTAELNGERVIDPGKVNTYMNQLGKPTAELKQDMLKNFLDASEKYRGVISDSHANLGLEAPFEHTSLAATKATLNEVTPGAKLADAFIKKGMGKISGAAVGGLAGAAVGHPVIGAVIGEHALGPFLDSALPSFAKSLSERAASGEGMQAASKFAMAAIKGKQLTAKAADALLKVGTNTKLDFAEADKAKVEKLEKWVEAASKDSNKVLTAGTALGHYMPDHGAAMGQKLANTVNYLSANKPVSHKPGLLDSPAPASPGAKAAYQRTLALAEQPLSVVHHIQNGTLTTKDIQDLNSLHPEAYQAISGQITRAITEKVAKGEQIPYHVRQSLSLFMAQPLDSSFSPGSIMAAQATFLPKQQGPQPGQPGKPPSASSMKGIAKLSDISATPGQARQKERQQPH